MCATVSAAIVGAAVAFDSSGGGAFAPFAFVFGDVAAAAAFAPFAPLFSAAAAVVAASSVAIFSL